MKQEICECGHPEEYHDVKEIRAVKGMKVGKYGVCGLCDDDGMFHDFKPCKKFEAKTTGNKVSQNKEERR